MQFRKTDLTVYVFVLAVLLSGMWMAEQFGMAWSPTLLATVAAVAAVWTVYYRFSIEPRVDANARRAEQRRDDDGTVSASAGTRDDV